MKSPVPTLTTERLLLRPLALDDADALFPALSDGQNMQYWSRGPLETVAELREYLRWNVEGEGVQCFAITRGGGPDQALGWVVLIDRKPGVAELGFITRPDAQGQGIAREAASQVLQHAFETRGLRRVFADVDPENRSSIGLLEALGFQREGHHRATWETHIGVRDSLIYARLSTDDSSHSRP